MNKNRKEKVSKLLALIGDAHVFATPDDVEILYVYRDGIYVLGETIIKEEIENVLGDGASTGLCGEIIAHFKRRSYVKRAAFNKFEGELPVLNGLLNLTTMKLRDFDPNKIFTFKVATKFDPTRDCPKFKAALEQILPNSDDRTLLQEYAGYTLLPAFSHHKFMIFIGGGRNGKGVFIRTMEGILGPDNVSNIRLEYLDGSHRFMIANLFGLMMNVCSEPSTRKPFRTELMKQICGQDTLDGEIKNKQRLLKFVSFAKHYVQANRLPVVDDKTPSFWDRVLIIEFTETFTDEKGNKVPDIEKTWLNDEAERSGILNWLIAGLKRLNENGKFTQTKSMDKKILEFKQVSDPIGAFLATPNECTYGSSQWTQNDTLYNSYKDWCEDMGATIESTATFSERLKRIPGIISRKKRIAGKAERIWRGIGLPIGESTLEDYESDPYEADEAPFTHWENSSNKIERECIEPASSASHGSLNKWETSSPYSSGNAEKVVNLEKLVDKLPKSTDTCADCKQPIKDESNIKWLNKERICRQCYYKRIQGK